MKERRTQNAIGSYVKFFGMQLILQMKIRKWLNSELRCATCTLTWFMNYTENQTRSKEEIKNSFLTFFKIQERPGELVREYDKRFKDLLSQILMTIDQNLLVQWYVFGILPRIFVL
jgi:hypothetical protein